MLDVQPAFFEDLHYGVCCEAAFGLSREASPRVPGGCMFASRGPVSIAVAAPLAKPSYARAPLSHSKYVGFYSGAAGLRVCPPPGTGASPPATRRARSEPLLHPILKRSSSGKIFMVFNAGEEKSIKQPSCASIYRIPQYSYVFATNNTVLQIK